MMSQGTRKIRAIVCSLAALLSFSLIPVVAHLSTPDATSSTNRKHAVIVGGGPVGLATAITLSNPPHSYDVTILEQQASVEQYDPTKAYLYNVNPRGQKWMKEYSPSALEKLKERGSLGSMSRITIVPADPNTPIPARKHLAAYDTKKNNPADNDNNAATVEMQETTTTQEEESKEEELDKRSFWIPRHSMICLLEDEIQEQQQQAANGQVGKIVLKKGRQFASMVPSDDNGGPLTVSVQDVENGTVESYDGSLVVAADGYNSEVRNVSP